MHYDSVKFYDNKWEKTTRINISRGFKVTHFSIRESNGDLRSVRVNGTPLGNKANRSISNFICNKFYYTGDSTSNKWNNVYGVWTNSILYGFFIVYDIKDYPTEDDLKAMIEDESTIFYYVVETPETKELALNKDFETYKDQTWIMTTDSLAPKLSCNCLVLEVLDYIKEGLLAYYTGRGRTNNDENKEILPDMSGNGNDLENKNFEYTPESGYGDGYIQYDGIDDFSGLKTSIPATKRTVLFTVSDIHRLNENINAWCGLIDGQNYFLGISNGTGFTQSGSYIINGVVSNDNFNILDKGDNIYVAGITDGVGEKRIDNITIGSILNRSSYACKCKIYDALIYNRELTEEEIEQNYKASLQFNGKLL